MVRTTSGRYDTQEDTFQKRYGDWAIVAGASEGLGAAWADTLCSFGLNVLLIARRQDVMTQLALELQNKYDGRIQVDTAVQDLMAPDLEEFFSALLKDERRQYGLLVFNAAHTTIGPFVEHSLESQYKTVDLNIRSVMTATHVFANHLKAKTQTGGIILMSSMAGQLGSAFIANYAATKAWQTAFAHALHYELAPDNIDILACVAGATTTPNYLQQAGQVARNPFIEQTPEDVVDECVQAMGGASSVVPGPINKLARFFLVRLLPLKTALHIFNQETEKLMQ